MGLAPGDVGDAREEAERSFGRDGRPEDRQVVVVGAGPAGSTAARFAAEAGADVLLIDRKSVVGKPVKCAGYVPGREELELMLPDVPDQGELYSIDDRFELARSHETLIVTPRGRRVALAFGGRTIDRAGWDGHLVDLAVRAGAEFRPSTRALGLESGVLRTDRGDLVPSVVVAADGPHSPTRRAAGLPEPRLIAPALNAPAEMQHAGRVEMHFCREAPGGYAWVIPAGRDRAHVGLGADPRRAPPDIRAALGSFAGRVGARLARVTGGFVPSAGPPRRTVRGNVMLAGDAAGHVMASNGGGLPIALAAGRVAGQVAARVVGGEGEVADYERGWRAQLGEVLSTSARFRWLAGLPLWSPLAMEMAMWAMPPSQMLRALRCQRLFWFY